MKMRMGNKWSMLLFLVIACQTTIRSMARSLPAEASPTSSGRPVRRTIKSPNGDIIDCVDFYSQPAFDHPLLKNRTIQIWPEDHPGVGKQQAAPTQKPWQKSGSCPEGTIPILRTQMLDTSTLSRTISATTNSDSGHLEWAAALNTNGSYVGASGYILGWNPHVEPEEYSLNFVGCGNSQGGKLTTMLIAGWAVFPSLYNDTKSRTFVALSIDNSLLSFNQDSGFVHINTNNYLGQEISPLAVYGDPNKGYSLHVAVYKDPALLKWCVIMLHELLGCFPAEIIDFVSLDTCLWGGNVLNRKQNPTLTEMGSGHFSNEGLYKTGAIDSARVMKVGKGDIVEPPQKLLVSRPLCYDFKNFGFRTDQHPGYTFLYGGPGSHGETCI